MRKFFKFVILWRILAPDTIMKDNLNSLITIFQDLQNEVSLLSDELDSDTLEEAKAAIDVVIEKIADALEENGWEVE